ncbi:hypothetical protein [Psychrobacillus sp. L4]|uniref:hypothetical protein n=1 Tax=Psychrobacillus sp. L4 TaxID=3236892 RepID=UPI0036F38E68
MDRWINVNKVGHILKLSEKNSTLFQISHWINVKRSAWNNVLGYRVSSLDGLQYARNLVMLDLTGNGIMDFSPLKDLKNLQSIHVTPQVLEIAAFKGPVVEFENHVRGIDGNKVTPT